MRIIQLLEQLNKLSGLSFPNAAVEKKFQTEQMALQLPQNILVAKLAIIIYLSYVPLVYLIVRNEFWLLFFISAFASSGVVGLLLVYKRAFFQKHSHMILAVAAFIVGFGPMIYYALTQNDRALFQVDILLPIVGIFTLYGIGFNLALLIVIALIFSFSLLCVIVGVPALDYFAALYVLVTGGVVTGAASYFMEKVYRKQFINKMESDEFRFLVENAQDSIAVFDTQLQHYLYANKIALECTGYEVSVLKEKTVEEIHPEFTSEVKAEIISRLDKTDSFSDVFQLYSQKEQRHYYVHIVFQYSYFETQKVIVTFSSDVTSQKEAEIKIQKMAVKDTLTGLYNRYKLDETSQQLISQAQRYGHTVSLILCDIDHFKKVNDRYGHLVGDQVLKHVAEIIVKETRESDIVARWGGEEFAVLLPGTTQEDAMYVAQKIQQSIAAEHIDVVEHMTISCGVSELLTSDSQMSWFNRVDQALYTAKREGRNRVCAL